MWGAAAALQEKVSARTVEDLSQTWCALTGRSQYLLSRRNVLINAIRKYEASNSFGTVTTASSNALWTSSVSSTSAGRAFVGANEDVLCWDVKTGELLARLHDNGNVANSEVTSIAQCEAQPDLIAAGHHDGTIRIWDSASGQLFLSLNGHRSAVTQLQFDEDGSRLASGSRDTDIIVWNVLAESAEFRLRGHKDQITGLSILRTRVNARQSPHTDEAVDVEEDDDDETEQRYLLSTSKDSLVKIWDLSSPHCVETHVAQTNGECWALGVSPDGSGCITAGNEGELKVWNIDLDALAGLNTSSGAEKKGNVLTSKGVFQRQGKDRTIGVAFHPQQDFIGVHGSEKAVELWRIRGADEVRRHMQRRRRRKREKAAASGETVASEGEESLGAPEVTDVFVPYVVVRTGGKLRSVSWMTGPSKSGRKPLQILAATTNNLLETYSVAQRQPNASEREAPEYSRSLAVDMPGHRTDIRTLALASDDRMLASASNGQLKIWNLKTTSCLRTLECGQALCSAFLPGDRIVLLGTKTGDLELFDIGTSTLIDSFKAHEGSIWSLAVSPDGKSVVTGSADKSAKFWRFDVVDEEVPGTRRTTQRLKLTQTRHLKVSDDVLGLAFSPDSRLVALSTLDNTVKVFFNDSLKLFLTLYGHKLPVLDLSISADSKLIATCSADKNVRIWGLDFGDCHKAFFAHNDSVMGVSFIPHPIENEERHILFSCSKDGVVKSWDGDKFEQIQRLEGHKGEVWAMAVGRTGEMLVTASHDKSIRSWQVGDDLVFLEEERERELEEMYESTLAQNIDRDMQQDGEQADGDNEVAAAGKQTIASLTHGEKVMEALEVGMVDLELMRAHDEQVATNPTAKIAVPQRNPLFLALGNISAEQHVLSTLQKIPTPSLHDALLVIPFSTLPTLFTFLAIFLKKRMHPDLAWRVTYFLLQAHMQQIVASKQLRGVLGDILRAYEEWQEEEMGVVGFNLAGLTVLGREGRESDGTHYLDEPVEEEDLMKGRKKRGFASVA